MLSKWWCYSCEWLFLPVVKLKLLFYDFCFCFLLLDLTASWLFFESDLFLRLQYCRRCYFPSSSPFGLGASCREICSFSVMLCLFPRHEYPEECNIRIHLPVSLITFFLIPLSSPSTVPFSSHWALAVVFSLLVNGGACSHFWKLFLCLCFQWTCGSGCL